MKRNPSVDAVLRELELHGIPWKMGRRGKHQFVAYLGQMQMVPCTSRSCSGALNSRAFTRRILKEKAVRT